MAGLGGMTPEEACRRGWETYVSQIRSKVEEGNIGSFCVIDVLTGQYEIDDEDLLRPIPALEVNPDAVLYIVRIGYRTAYHFRGPRLILD